MNEQNNKQISYLYLPERYEGACVLIDDLIREHNGQMPLADLEAELISLFKVNPLTAATKENLASIFNEQPSRERLSLYQVSDGYILSRATASREQIRKLVETPAKNS